MLDGLALGLTIVAAVLRLRLRMGILSTLAISAALGFALSSVV